MFKLPNGIPTLRTSPQDWADYAEYLAIQNGRVSFRELVKVSSIIDDEIEVLGVEDDSDKFVAMFDDIAKEILRRKDFSNQRYPFNLTDQDYSLTYDDSDQTHNWIYKFLLLSTRLKMSNDKIHAGIDGTLLFEELSAQVALSYFGNNANVDVLGTSKSHSGGFRTKLENITKKMGEGGKIHENIGYRPQDDNVDVIIWKGFSDRQPSQMIGFGQCKTGTSWQNNLSELNTSAFCNTWFSQQPILHPIRMFFCAQYFPRDLWYPRGYEAGLVFDRFRILDYLPEVLPITLQEKIKSWCIDAWAKYNTTSSS